ncbi:MAG: RNA polymerase sigma factor [Bacteroidetes bacterium]|nr:RNA polymerase sigma factor [Bacteroidota bacterium]
MSQKSNYHSLPLAKTDDREILQLIREKESLEQGFKLLVGKYQARLYWHIRRMILNHNDSDDVLQNTFIKVWKGLPGFRGESQLFTWLYRIASNEALSFLKKNRRYHHISLYDAAQELVGYIDDDPLYTGDELSKKLQQAILSLPPKQRLVFNMKYFEEMKYKDISAVLGTSIGALKASYHLAVKKIEKQILPD